MRTYRKCLHYCLLLAAFLCGSAHAEDIDIFAGTSEVDATVPNVIFVLDNTSNWSRMAQWGDKTQGAAEVLAIKRALQGLEGRLNVGLMLYETTLGGGDGGYVRFDLQLMDGTATGESNGLGRFSDLMDYMAENTEGTLEKRNSNNKYGYLPYDFYNYLAGVPHSAGGSKTPVTLADSDAYETDYSLFESPIGSVDDVCADTYMIYIGNNKEGSVDGDDAANSTALKNLYQAAGATAPDALYGDGGTPLAQPEFVVTDITLPDTVVPGECYEAQERVWVEPVDIESDDLGSSTACYTTSEQSSCTTDENSASGLCGGKSNCSCIADNTNYSGCKRNGPPSQRTSRWDVYYEGETISGYWREATSYYCDPDVTIPGEPATVITETGDYDTTGGLDYNLDDWTKFMYNQGVPVVVTDDDGTVYNNERARVVTYMIDVFDSQQREDLSQLWYSAANAGGGRYFQAKSEEDIIAAINSVLGDILSVSSSFAAVSLPLSATNSARRANEIYIGMFRPAPGKSPRWFGNLKRFQLAVFNGQPQLADVNLRRAVNALTGFATECAASFWTSDTDRYWESLGVNPPPEGQCQAAIDAGKQWSDLPDGPFVEKGGVAQMTREGPAGTSRALYTVKSNALALIADGDAEETLLNYFRGDSPGVGEVMPAAGLRASIHGDVVHSRPLTIRYDDDTVRIYYGANDGPFRAANTATGEEKWAFLAPEHFARIQRLYDDTPLVDYEGATQEVGLVYSSKDYFFDGPTGQIVTYAEPDDPDSEALGDLESAYIYPTMRRGGRMVYGFDVTDPDTPELLWRKGCPNLDDDDGCSAGFTDMGQSWSTPIGLYAAEYPGNDEPPEPLLVFGGGFDDCLNADQAAYPTGCSSANGKGVYVLDAVTGALVKKFDTDAPVITQVAPIDVDADGLVDFIYVADVAGNLYRILKADLTIDLTNLTDVPPGAIVPRDDDTTGHDEWIIEKIAAIPGTQRRFYNSPTVGIFRGTIFVTIGSGDRERPLEANYPYNENVQNRFYVLADSPHADWLAEQQAITDGLTYTRRVVDLEGNTMFEVGTDLEENQDLRDFDGWYLDLPDRGEQVANPSAIGGGKVLFNTFQPGGVSVGICARPLGIGKNYAVDLFSPEVPETSECAGGGYCIPPVIATVEDIPPGCEDGEDCYFVPPEDCEGADCQPDCDDADIDCEVKTICIIGGFNVCTLDPDIDPFRARTYFTEDIDRSVP